LYHFHATVIPTARASHWWACAEFIEVSVLLPAPLRPMPALSAIEGMVRRGVAHDFAAFHFEGNVAQSPENIRGGRAEGRGQRVVKGGEAAEAAEVFGGLAEEGGEGGGDACPEHFTFAQCKFCRREGVGEGFEGEWVWKFVSFGQFVTDSSLLLSQMRRIGRIFKS